MSNNARIALFGDSLQVDSQAPSVGYRWPDFLESYFQLNYPGANIHVFNLGRSGGTMDDRLTNALQKLGLGYWGYQSNSYQCIGVSSSTDNAGLTSNQMYLSHSNIFQATGLMSDGDASLVTHSGWASAHNVQWIGLGEIPVGSDGSPATGTGNSEQDRNDAGTNAGWRLGIRGVDWWHRLVHGETNDFNTMGGTNAGWQKGGHPGPGMELAMTFAFLEAITTDTNISTATVAYNSATPVATNHCFISNLQWNVAGGSWNRLDDRLPFAWENTNNFEVSMTNDCSPCFTMYPEMANDFQYTIKVTGLPAGSYGYYEDGELIHIYSSVELANGINLFTNFVGPTGRQRQGVLGLIRDKEHVGRTDHLPRSASDGVGMVSYGSFASSYWSSPNNYRGEQLRAALDANTAQVFGMDANTAAAAVPTNHVDSLVRLNQMNVGTLNVYALLVPTGTVGNWLVKYGPGYDPNAFNWYAVVSPDLVHWTMWGSHTLDDTDDLVYRPPKGGTMFAYAVGYPKREGQQ